MYPTRDSLRSLIAWGYKQLGDLPHTKPLLSLDAQYLAILLASKKLSARLPLELKAARHSPPKTPSNLPFRMAARITITVCCFY